MAATRALKRHAEGARPNVLFIPIDDLNDWVGHLGGHPQAHTPSIDALADRGVSFASAHCSAPCCNPSRASLLTGVPPSTSGIYENHQPVDLAMPDAVTLPQLLRESGYHAIGRGKVFHGPEADPAWWDEYIPKSPDPRPAEDDFPLNGIPGTGNFDWGPLDVSDDEMDDAKVAQWGVEQIRGGLPEPFFLACGFFRPHLPWYGPRRYFEMFPEDEIILPTVNDNDLDDIPEAGRRFARTQDHEAVVSTSNWQRAVQGYLACGAFVDTQIGRVLDALYASPYADNTIVVLWGDHGWHLGEKLHWRKFALWEEATHAPLVLSVPGVAPAGETSPRTVTFLDVYPTLADLCDLQPPDGQLEGVTMRPLLEDPSAEWDRPAVTTHLRGNHSVRSETWRYIRYADGSEELYDEVHDPLEWANLANRPEYAEVRAELACWLPKVNAAEAPGQER